MGDPTAGAPPGATVGCVERDCQHKIPLLGIHTPTWTPVRRETPCKRYHCPACGPGRRARCRNLIIEGTRYIHELSPTTRLRMLTLTLPRDDGATFGVRADHLRVSRMFRRWIQALRRGGLVIEYVKVLESTKTGRIHIHVLCWGTYLPKCSDKGRRRRHMRTGRGSGSPCYCSDRRPCVQRAAHMYGFGWVDVREASNPAKAAAYVAKYITKQAGIQEWPKCARRMSYSRMYAGGETMGSIEARWFTEVKARWSAERRDAYDRELAEIEWIGPEWRRPHRIADYPVDPPDMTRWSVDGERLPVPY